MIIIDDHRLGIFDLMVLGAPDEKIVIGGPYPAAALQFAKRRAGKIGYELPIILSHWEVHTVQSQIERQHADQ